jgi:hypothetical protein
MKMVGATEARNEWNISRFLLATSGAALYLNSCTQPLNVFGSPAQFK